jgi:hypothetical protein
LGERALTPEQAPEVAGAVLAGAGRRLRGLMFREGHDGRELAELAGRLEALERELGDARREAAEALAAHDDAIELALIAARRASTA